MRVQYRVALITEFQAERFIGGHKENVTLRNIDLSMLPILSLVNGSMSFIPEARLVLLNIEPEYLVNLRVGDLLHVTID